jgi:hypothetical protein
VQLLRAWLLVFGGIMLAAADFGALFGCRLAPMIPLALWGAILAGGVLVERWRYQLLARAPAPAANRVHRRAGTAMRLLSQRLGS